MRTAHWEELYFRTIQEVDSQKIQEGIAATRQAITGRLRDIEHDRDHHGERHRMEKVLKTLKTLEGEIRNWPLPSQPLADNIKLGE